MISVTKILIIYPLLNIAAHLAMNISTADFPLLAAKLTEQGQPTLVIPQ